MAKKEKRINKYKIGLYISLTITLVLMLYILIKNKDFGSMIKTLDYWSIG